MQRHSHWLFAGLAVAGIAISGCGTTSQVQGIQARPAHLEPIAGTSQSRIVLTPGTAERLGIRTQVVVEHSMKLRGAQSATLHDVIPLTAIFYDKNGATWAYTSTDPQNYVRRSVTIAEIDGDQAVLLSGPDPGTEIVTEGAPELLGIEQGVGGD